MSPKFASSAWSIKNTQSIKFSNLWRREGGVCHSCKSHFRCTFHSHPWTASRRTRCWKISRNAVNFYRKIHQLRRIVQRFSFTVLVQVCPNQVRTKLWQRFWHLHWSKLKKIINYSLLLFQYYIIICFKFKYWIISWYYTVEHEIFERI